MDIGILLKYDKYQISWKSADNEGRNQRKKYAAG